MSHFWSGFIIFLVSANILGCFILLRVTAKKKIDHASKTETTGHVWDDDLTELNTPLPRWWLGLFYITLVFGIGYLALYPGLGNFSGLLGWSTDTAYQQQQTENKQKYSALFEKYENQNIPALAKNTEAMKTAQRLFANNCAACHGSDAQGAPGFPNLTDHDWLYGGTPENIEASITHGRQGSMPSFANSLSDADKDNLIAYINQLHGEAAYSEQAQKGQNLFSQNCIACHGANAQGNQQIGSANLTDNIWLYGGSDEIIKETLTKGRSGKMPAHEKLLDEQTIHLLAAYVYSLSQK